jgi:hypothetical protein
MMARRARSLIVSPFPVLGLGLGTTLEVVEVLLEGVEVIGPETAIAALPRIELGDTFGMDLVNSAGGLCKIRTR